MARDASARKADHAPLIRRDAHRGPWVVQRAFVKHRLRRDARTDTRLLQFPAINPSLGFDLRGHAF
jgi:hypothetical protein